MNASEHIIPTIGAALEGGFFAGTIAIDGRHYGIVVAPKAAGANGLQQWNKAVKRVAAATSFFDGMANTEAMVAADSKLAKWARGLDIGGYADWYLPARDELELVYRAFKPTAAGNACWRGDNPSSVPVGYAYQPNLPGQTAAAAFQLGGKQAFSDNWYWTSTQSAGYEQSAWGQRFDYGYQNTTHKTSKLRARAVRRFAL